jgi:hypothetical protein
LHNYYCITTIAVRGNIRGAQPICYPIFFVTVMMMIIPKYGVRSTFYHGYFLNKLLWIFTSICGICIFTTLLHTQTFIRQQD